MSFTTKAATCSSKLKTPSPSSKRRCHPNDQSTAENVPTRHELWRWCLRADAVAQCYIRDVLALRESEKDSGRDQDTFWWLGTVPCRSVRFVGIVVGARAYDRRTMYIVDDGTGAIECFHPRAVAGREKSKYKKQANLPLPPTTLDDFPKPDYEVGDILRVAGRIEKWHDAFQIFVNNIELCRPNDEPDHWLETAKLHETYYSQPFVIPPLPPPPPPPPKTPVKPVSKASALTTPGTVTTVATPSTAASTPSATVEGAVRLRHPSRLHSKELISSTFKIYLKNYMDILSDPSWTPPLSLSQSDDNVSLSFVAESPTKRLKRSHRIDDAATPKPKDRRSKLWQDGEETPRPSYRDRKENTTQSSRTRRQKGFTLSYLRRVPELADMAFRVVRAETKRRARQARHKQKEIARAGKMQRPLEANETQPEPESKKAKRLYAWAIRELYREGGIILHEDDAPIWEASSASRDARGVWKPRKAADQSVDAGRTEFSVFSDIKGGTCEGDDRGELSEPPAHEESYLPLTPSLLTEPIMDTIKNMMLRKPGTDKRPVGPTVQELREYMGKLDARWENVSEYVVADALQLLKAQDRVYGIGKGRWEITL